MTPEELRKAQGRSWRWIARTMGICDRYLLRMRQGDSPWLPKHRAAFAAAMDVPEGAIAWLPTRPGVAPDARDMGTLPDSA